MSKMKYMITEKGKYYSCSMLTLIGFTQEANDLWLPAQYQLYNVL